VDDITATTLDVQNGHLKHQKKQWNKSYQKAMSMTTDQHEDNLRRRSSSLSSTGSLVSFVYGGGGHADETNEFANPDLIQVGKRPSTAHGNHSHLHMNAYERAAKIHRKAEQLHHPPKKQIENANPSSQ
jgi:hypothetical protein